MRQLIWLSYDLGVSGDYEGLYAWLDSQGAKECGDSLAVIDYPVKGDPVAKLKKDLRKAVRLGKRERIYVVYKIEDRIKGSFLFGKRKQSPWTGYGIPERQELTDE